MSLSVANAIRFLSIDAIEKAKSGHPGAPMGMAEMAEALWLNFLQHNPNNPNFYNRDRFVLSNGHASMLIYSLLHLTGYQISIEDIKNFRQFNSKTPGHPEWGHTVGVETTTGPLGQGIANAVGFAMVEKILGDEFNTAEFKIVDHHTYVFVGDGCLMEGISHEACSLAGTLGLGKLIVLYDSNKISIDGNIEGWFTDNVEERFKSYNWQVITNIDGHDVETIKNAISLAKENSNQPSIICCNTIIGKGSPNKANSAHVHGSSLGEEETLATKKFLNWPYQEFEIPEEIYKMSDAKEKGAQLEAKWNALFERYQKEFPQKAREFLRRMNHQLPDSFNQDTSSELQNINTKKEIIATRKASQNSITILKKYLPELIGGSADLTPSNLTIWKGAKVMNAKEGGDYIHYGVREFAMCAIINGMFLHGGVRPFAATFLMFSEYARNAIRMAALMKIGAIFVFTHDSIGLGEDGPTHQPIEQISTLRLIPNISVWRPCDTVETFVAWEDAIRKINQPSCLVFSRQNLPFTQRTNQQIKEIRHGGYILQKSKNLPQAIIIATGSEVQLALDAQKELETQNIHVQVVSMPNTNIFDKQPQSYQDTILLPELPKIAIEAGVSDFWHKYVKGNGAIIGIDQLAQSAPAEKLFEEFGFTLNNVIKIVKEVLLKS